MVVVCYYGVQLSVAGFLATTVALTIVAVFIDTLFRNDIICDRHTYESLADKNPEFYEKVKEEAEKHSLKIDEFLVMDGSTESSHSNMYVQGFYKKRIVVFDTIFEHLKDDRMLLAVMLHEFCHEIKGHLRAQLVFYFILRPLQTAFLALCILYKEQWLGVFGITYNSIFIAVFVAQHFLLTFVQWIASTYENYTIRKSEYEADAFSYEHSKEGDKH